MVHTRGVWKKLMILAVLGTLGFGSVAQATVFSDITLGQAQALGLGIFVTGPTQISASNSGTDFNTNMGLASGASTNFSGGGTLTGTLYEDPAASVQSNLSSQFNVTGGIVTQSLAQAVSDVVNAADNAALLTPDQIFGSIGGSALTINPTGALNASGGHNTVVKVNGNISITNPSNDLTINGGANDFYIIDVTGDVAVSNGAITTSGGIPASHILFNVEGTGDSVDLSNSTSVLTGTYLAPDANQTITISPGTVNGALIGYQIQDSSGPTINGALYTPSPVPEPSTVLLLGSGLAGLGGIAWRRRRRM